MHNKKPILVTGSHRSGSTWIGSIIAKEPTVGYIHEPFNPDYYPHQAGRYTARFDRWFTCVSAENEAIYVRELKNALEFRYQLSPAVHKLLGDRDRSKSVESLRILREYLLCTKNRFKQSRPLVKDPIALFSAEWMAEKFDMDVIVSIRHPAAFVGSLKVANWHFPFEDFLSQKLLIEGFLSPFKAEIENIVDRQSEMDQIDRWALLWKIIHVRILNYQKTCPNWLFVRHEDLSQDPVEEFRTIFDYLNLNYSQSLQKTISQYTSGQYNPGDIKIYAKKASRVMDSKANVKSWQKRLSPSEVMRIRQKVEDIAGRFYTDSDWE